MPGESVLLQRERGQARPFSAASLGMKSATFSQENISRSGLSLKANFSWTLVGNIVYAGCQWAMLSVLAKLGSVEMVGQFALGLAVATPIIVFANLNLQSVQATDVHDEFEFGIYLALRLLMLCAAGLVMTAICLFGRCSGDTAVVVMGVTLAKIVESLGELFYGLFLRHERMDFVAVSRIAKGVVSVGFFAVTLYLTQSLLWAVLAQAVAFALPLFWYDVRCGSHILAGTQKDSQSAFFGLFGRHIPVPRWDLKQIRRLTLLALPLAIATVLVSLGVNVPRYFVAYYCGKTELGYFVALVYVTTVLDMIVRPLVTVAMPRLAVYFQKNPAAYIRCLAKIVAIVAVLGLLAIMTTLGLGREILRFLYAEEYANYRSEFVAITVSAAITAIATVLSIAGTSARLFRWQMFVYAINLVLVSGASVLFIPEKALYGAILALGATAGFRVIFYLCLLGYFLRKREAFDLSPCEEAQPCNV